MAIMHPPFLPDDVLTDPMLGAEVRVYNELSKLSDEYDVYHDGWVKTQHAGDAEARKIDFIILHQKLGFMAIEVKGAKGPSGLGDGIRIVGGRLQQYIGKKNKVDLWKDIDPYGQVAQAIHSLNKVLKKEGVTHWFKKNYAVIFPHTPRNFLIGIDDSHTSCTLCAEDMPNLATAIIKLYPNAKPWSNSAAYFSIKEKLVSIPKQLSKPRWKKKIEAGVEKVARAAVSFNSYIPSSKPLKKAKQNKFEEAKPEKPSKPQDEFATIREEKIRAHLASRNHQPVSYEDRYLPKTEERTERFSLWWGIPLVFILILLLGYITWQIKRKFF